MDKYFESNRSILVSDYRIIIQARNKKGNYVNKEVIKSGTIEKPESILDLGFRHTEQIEIIQKIQDNILSLQSSYLRAEIISCPICGNQLAKNGATKSTFNSVFTDHKVAVQKLVCCKCRWMSVPSVDSLFGTHMHPDLVKMQCEVAAVESYSNAEDILNKKSAKKRTVNNTMTLHKVVEKVGNYISNNPELHIPDNIKSADELVAQTDGGHLKTSEEGKRSFEALTSVIYRPDNVHNKGKDNRGAITGKHCAASALDDSLHKIIQSTLAAAKKEGLTGKTRIIALCDGADNCWNVINSLEEHCAGIERILDWFHITMKFKNIAVSELNKDLFERAKWSIWHGDLVGAAFKLTELFGKTKKTKDKKRILKLRNYLINNYDKITNYSERKRDGLIFTSNMAEATVETLINRRCKGKQHMKWSRDGVHPLLQIRAEIESNDWCMNYENYILGAHAKTA